MKDLSSPIIATPLVVEQYNQAALIGDAAAVAVLRGVPSAHAKRLDVLIATPNVPGATVTVTLQVFGAGRRLSLVLPLLAAAPCNGSTHAAAYDVTVPGTIMGSSFDVLVAVTNSNQTVAAWVIARS